jgi:hypothetical protein
MPMTNLAVTNLGDLLSASSLVVALLTFLYSLAHPTHSAALETTLGTRQIADAGPERRQVRAARKSALLFAVAATLATAIFLPDSIRLSWHFLGRLNRGFDAVSGYNALATSFVLITAACLALAAHALSIAVRLDAHLADFGGQRYLPMRLLA